MRKSLHTSEIYAARKKAQEAVDILTRDAATYANTYIPTAEIEKAADLLHEAASDMGALLYIEEGGKRRIAQQTTDLPAGDGYFPDGDGSAD